MSFSLRDLLMPAVLAVFFFVFYLVYEDIKDRTIEDFNNEQLILARTAAQGMTAFFEEQQSGLDFLAKFRHIVEFSEPGETLLERYYEAHKSSIEAVTRVDADGVIVFTSPYESSVIGNDISYQDHVRKVIATQKPVISDVFMAAQGYLAIALHVPVFDDGRYDGSLAVLIPIDNLGQRYLGDIVNRGTGKAWLLTENGVEIYCPDTVHIGKLLTENLGNDASATDLMAKIRTQQSGTVKGIHSNTNGQYISFYRTPLGNTYWTILLSYQEKDIYAAIARLRNRLILVFFLLFVTISFFFYSNARMRNVLRLEAERKKAQDTLLKSEEKFRRLFEDHKAVKLLIDPGDGSIVDANKSASTYYGYTREELQTMKISQINILSEDEIKTRMGSVRSKEENKFEFRHKLKNGSVRDVEVFSSAVEIEGREILHSIIYDITYRKQMEEELIRSKEKAEESDRLKTAFLQNMSHEIRTPMNAVIGFSSLLPEYFDDKPKLEEYAEIITQRSNDLLDIINDILDISKIESGQLTLNLEDLRLEEFFKDLRSFFYGYQKRTGKEEIAFTFEVPENIAHKAFLADRGKLRQVFVNLLSNAFKFTCEGKVEGGCSIEGNQELVFYVSDTGSGIPEEKKDVVFERFAQIDQPKGRLISGTGLGLAITKGLVELMGGRIWLESEPGKGTSFFFSLPYQPVEPAESDIDNTRGKTALDFHGKTILLVEDDEFNSTYIREVLSVTGSAILHAGSGHEAVQLASAEAPDLILMDIRLPDIDGYEATALILQKNPDARIITQTAYATTEDKKRALDAGCIDYISKPIDRELLLSMLETYLR